MKIFYHMILTHFYARKLRKLEFYNLPKYRAAAESDYYDYLIDKWAYHHKLWKGL